MPSAEFEITEKKERQIPTQLLQHALPCVSIINLTNCVSSVAEVNPSPYSSDQIYSTFFDQISRALYRGEPRHIVLIREPGVGDQAALVELARTALKGCPPFLANKQFIAIDCQHVPLDQIRSVIDQVFEKAASSESLVLCVNGLTSLLANFGTQDNRSMILGFLARARCRVMAILSPHESEEMISIEPAFREMFSFVNLPEPALHLATELVRHFATGLQAQHGVQISPEAIIRAVTLSNDFILHERLPQKAVKVLRSICEDVDYDRSQLEKRRDQINGQDVLAKIAQITGIPDATLAGVGDCVDYASSLSSFIVGQPHAVREVATELSLIRSGFVDGGKPASVMMFIGQTGTGKTEMAKVLARFYSASKHLKTFTLGNFSEPHSVSGIIGVPAGYVGHDQGGRLVNELIADPYGVFLLDEADKAHPDVMQPFLNLFDEGWICDQKGAKAYASRAIFILTTNVGQRQIAEMCKNGKSIDEITWTMKESLSRIKHSKSNLPVFTPEFLARVKRFVVFRSLDEEAMEGICKRLVVEMQEDWRNKRLRILQIPLALIQAIAKKAFETNELSNGREGGRIVRKLIVQLIEVPIQKAIGARSQEYLQCRQVNVTVGGQTLATEISDIENAIRVEFDAT